MISSTPKVWLHYIGERVSERPINRVEELLPWAVADALQFERQQRLAA